MVTIAQYRKIVGSVPGGAAFQSYGDNVKDWCPVGAPTYDTLRNSKAATTALSSDATSVSFFERLNALTGGGKPDPRLFEAILPDYFEVDYVRVFDEA